MFIMNIGEGIFVNITVTSEDIYFRFVPWISTQHLICTFTLFPYKLHICVEYS